MKKTDKKTLPEQIKELKQQIISNSKDAKWAEKMLSQLTSLQKQSDVEPAELIVPVKEVKDVYDGGAWSLKKTIRGILWEAKGGMATFVESRMTSVYTMLEQVLDVCQNPAADPKERNLQESFVEAVAYVMQSPIFSSLNEMALFDNATQLLKAFNEYCNTNYTNAEPKDETEEDVKANNEFEAANEMMQAIVDSPLPPEEEDQDD